MSFPPRYLLDVSVRAKRVGGVGCWACGAGHVHEFEVRRMVEKAGRECGEIVAGQSPANRGVVLWARVTMRRLDTRCQWQRVDVQLS